MLERFKPHFDDGYCEGIHQYARSVALWDSCYIFISGPPKNRRGHSTCCDYEFDVIGKIKHKSKYECPGCEMICQVRNAKLSRKYFIDEAYFVYFEKSKLDPNIITARGIYASLDFRGDYKNVRPQFVTKAYYIFEVGKGAQLLHNAYACTDRYGGSYYDKWQLGKKINCISIRYHTLGNIRTGVAEKSLKEAVEGTLFKYCAWESYAPAYYSNIDVIEYLALYSAHPCTEYLTKAGFRILVLLKLSGSSLERAVNWDGKSLPQVLKLPKHRLKEFMNSNLPKDLDGLRLMQLFNRDVKSYTIKDVEYLKSLMSIAFNVESLNDIFLPHMGLMDLCKYLRRQQRKDERADMICYRDYLRDCITLNLDLSNPAILFPTNLYHAHVEAFNQITLKRDQEIAEKFAKRAEALSRYMDLDERLIIKPVEEPEVLFVESEVLKHCVKTYTSDYAYERCDLYVVRRLGKEDTPYVTVEMKGDKFVQARCYKNKRPPRKVRKFISQFVEKLGGDDAIAI